jgi:hypothetical protein
MAYDASDLLGSSQLPWVMVSPRGASGVRGWARKQAEQTVSLLADQERGT